MGEDRQVALSTREMDTIRRAQSGLHRIHGIFHGARANLDPLGAGDPLKTAEATRVFRLTAWFCQWAHRESTPGVWPQNPHVATCASMSPLSSQTARIGQEAGAASKGQRDGEVGNIYHLFEKKGGVPKREVCR
jgi:hypothetical protein